MSEASKIAHVIGSPISHSLSPAIFSYISYFERINIHYSTYEVKERNLEDFINYTKQHKKIVGFNVTLPLKEKIISKIHSLSPEADAIGAVNVIHIHEDKMYGYNTDVIGIQKSLEDTLHPKDKNCLLWGAGGAAKAVAYVLGSMNAAKVYVYNRSERSKELVDRFQSLFPSTRFIVISNIEEINDSISILINSTPLGMTGKESGTENFLQMKSLKIAKPSLAFDLIYTPGHTRFMKIAESINIHTIGGLPMLIDQAIATWEIWIGPISDSKKLHAKLIAYIRGILKLREDPSPIYLTGFMGVGKSTVAEILSQITGRAFIDSDTAIVEIAQESIPSLFETKGEKYFREIEKQAIDNISSKKSIVVSLGGGALQKNENLETIKSTGKLIYLKAHPLVLEMRILGQDIERPLLKDLTKEERIIKIENMLFDRSHIYEMADYKIRTDELTSQEVAMEILCHFGDDNA